MKLNKLFVLIPLALLALGGCAEGNEGVKNNNGDDISQDTSGNGEGNSQGSSNEQVTLPLSYDPSKEFAAGTGWSYITNNPEYPDPYYYKTDGVITGLKLGFPGIGIASGKFDAVDNLKITINIKKLNGKRSVPPAVSENAFEVSGYNASGNKVAMAAILKADLQMAGDYFVNLAGDDITSVKIIMSDYPLVGGEAKNVNLSGANIEI